MGPRPVQFLIGKKWQVKISKEGVLFFCYIVILQKKFKYLLYEDKHLWFHCQALNKIFTLKTKIKLPFSVWTRSTVVFSSVSCLDDSQKSGWPQVGWLSFGGEKLKTVIKIIQSPLKSRFVFQGIHLRGKIHI